jgi:hypothetical protein
MTAVPMARTARTPARREQRRCPGVFLLAAGRPFLGGAALLVAVLACRRDGRASGVRAALRVVERLCLRQQGARRTVEPPA